MRWTLAIAILAASSTAWAQTIPVHVNSTPPGAQVFVDDPNGVSIGVTPLKSVRISRGQHTLHFQLSGYETASLPVNVARRAETFSMTLVQLGRIELTGSGDADGATVRIDGEIVGTIPVERLLKQGRHELRVSKEGFSDLSQWFEIRPGETRAQTIVLERERPPAGSLLVAGDVPGAVVLVDGRERGRSPVVVDDLAPGAHTVEIRAQDLPTWAQTVTVEAGQRLTVNPRLRPERPASGSLRVISNVEGAQVVLDGDPIGVVPADAPELAPGNHIVEVMARGHEPARQDVVIQAGQREVVRMELTPLPEEAPTASLRVVSPVPNAQVFLDGQLAGPAPLSRDDLSVGTHYVTVQAPGYRDFVRNVNLQAGQQFELSAELVPVAVLRVRANVDGAHVFLDGDAIGRVPFESSSVPAGDHQIEVRMEGYDTYAEALTLIPGQPRELQVELVESQVGPTEEEKERFRRTMMPWAATPLPDGEVAFDMSTGWPYLVDFRFGVGILSFIDAGVGIQTYFETTEFSGRVRTLLRPFPAIGLGAEGSIGGGLGPGDRDAFLLAASGLASLFFGERGAFTLRLDIESSTERVAEEPKDMTCEDVSLSSNQRAREGCERDENLRVLLGGTMELVLSRYWNFFGQFRGVLIGGDRLAYEDLLFLDNEDGGLYFKLGFTYKF